MVTILFLLLFYDILLGTTSSDMTVIDVTSTTDVTVTSMSYPSHVSKLKYYITCMYRWFVSASNSSTNGIGLYC